MFRFSNLKMYQHFIFKIVFIFCLSSVLYALDDVSTVVDVSTVKENKTVESSTLLSTSSSNSEPVTSQESSRSISTSTAIPVATSSVVPIIPPLKNSICGLPFKTSNAKGPTDGKNCTCDGFQGIVDCTHLSITELPKEISFPEDIKKADFHGNSISNIKNGTFYNARELMEMDFSYNQIDFISISAFKNFKKLTKLDLSHNKIWNLPTGMFEGLGHLQRLDLSFNDLINVFHKHLSNLVELRELYLRNNPLQELEPKHFEKLKKLEHLDLESTLLKVIPDHVFIFTPNLKYLKLGNNQLTIVPTEALHVLDHLNVLDLSGNPIAVIPPQAFRGLTGLTILYMERMSHLTSIEEYAFGDMIHLQELHCSYNFKLTDIAPHAFVKRSNNMKVELSQLFLRQNELSEIPQTLLNWNQGMELHLRDNPIHCDCNAEWMVHLKLKNNFQNHARCYSPGAFEGVALSELKGQELTCGLHLTDIVLITCGVVFGLLMIVLIVSCLHWRRNYRGYTKPHYYKTNKNINDIDYAGGDDGF